MWKVRDYFANGRQLTHEFPTVEMALEMLKTVGQYAKAAPGVIIRVSIIGPQGREVAQWTPK